MSGVVYLWTSGSWPLAVVVFIASIAVPMLKIIAIMFLVISTQRRSLALLQAEDAHLPRGGTRRALVDARYLRDHHSRRARPVQCARDHPGRSGRVAFGAVVVLTMFAAMSFDPRLIWDAAEHDHG